MILSACSGNYKPDSVGQPPSSVSAGTVKLAWDGSFISPGVLDPSVTGYRIYYGTSPRDYTDTVDAGLAYTGKVEGLPRTKLYFALTAYNAQGMESDFSDEVSVDLAANPTAIIRVGQ